MTNYHIDGLIRHRENQRGIPNLLVEAYDYDLLYDQKLGAATTDAEGKFRITFHTRDFRRLFERHPDIYLKIWNQQGVLIHSTRSQLRVNAGKKESYLIELPRPPERGKGMLIGGILVDKGAFAGMTPEAIGALAAAYYGEPLNNKTQELLEAVNPQLLDPIRRRHRSLDTHCCLTPFMTFVEAAWRHRQAPAGLLEKFDRQRFNCPGGHEVHETAHFRIHYQRWRQPIEFWEPASGAVLPADTPAVEVRRFHDDEQVIGMTVADCGVPNYIQQVAIWLEYVYKRYVRDFEFPDPLPAQKKLKVLVRYLPGASGCAGRNFIEISNDLNARSLAGAIVHQLFHAVQATCLASTSNAPFEDWAPFLLEGLPLLMEDLLNNNLKRWISDANTFLNHTGEPVSLPYLQRESILFWKYMTEQYTSTVSASGQRARGADVVGKVLKSIAFNGRADIRALKFLWQQDSGPYRLPRYGSMCCFQRSEPLAQDIFTTETAFGNWLVANFMQFFNRQKGFDQRFTYFDAQGEAPGGTSLSPLASIEEIDWPDHDKLSINGELPAWAARYHLIRLEKELNTAVVTLDQTTIEKPLIHLLQLVDDKGEFRIHDMSKFDGPFRKSINCTDLDALVLIIGATDSGGRYLVQVSNSEPVSDVMITRWNCRQGKEYEFNPANGAWHWLSPDLWVDNEHDGKTAGALRPGSANRLWVRLRNKGTADASNISLRCFWQEASPNPQEKQWQPVHTSPEGKTATLDRLSLRAGETKCWAVDWYIPAAMPATCRGYALKVSVYSPDDRNSDNKTAISNYAVMDGKTLNGNGTAIVFLSWWPQLKSSDHTGSLEFLETWVVPANDPKLLLRLRDLRNLQRISLKDILSHMPVTMTESNKSSKMPSLMMESRLHITAPNRLGLPSNPFLEIAAADAAPLFVAPQNRNIDTEAVPPGLASQPLLTIVQAHRGLVLGGISIVPWSN